MKYLVVYDTSYGNTAKVALAIQRGLGADAAATEVEKIVPADLAGVDLIVVGSPTQNGRPTRSIQDWLETLGPLEAHAAAFDTRLGGPGSNWLKRFALDLAGYAAPKISAKLARQGLALVDAPQGFIVGEAEGPLLEGELARATTWGATLAAQAPVAQTKLGAS